VSMRDTEHFGLLVARMEPAALADYEEFHDWYDFEHIPQRLATPGFLSAQRFVCPQGWPRFIATYDLESPRATMGAKYSSETGHGFTPWSKRILSRVHPGWSRLDMEQVHPGRAMSRAGWTGMMLLQFSGVDAALVSGVAARLAAAAPLLQVRAFVGTAAPEPAAAIMLEAPALALLPSWTGFDLADRLGDLAGALIMSHTYTKYARSDAFAGVLTRLDANTGHD
jgi:hypothetical protein